MYLNDLYKISLQEKDKTNLKRIIKPKQEILQMIT